MKTIKIFASLLFLSLCFVEMQAQLVYTTRSGASRMIDPGKGQEFSRNFIPASSFHFVQFGVYPSTTNWRDIMAPHNVGQVWLIHHGQTIVKGSTANGAYYIVKPFATAMEARQYAARYKKTGIDAWFNPDLTGAPFVLHAFTKL